MTTQLSDSQPPLTSQRLRCNVSCSATTPINPGAEVLSWIFAWNRDVELSSPRARTHGGTPVALGETLNFSGSPSFVARLCNLLTHRFDPRGVHLCRSPLTSLRDLTISHRAGFELSFGHFTDAY